MAPYPRKLDHGPETIRSFCIHLPAQPKGAVKPDETKGEVLELEIS